MSDRLNVVIFLAWIVASVSTLGSLFFSEVMAFPPCVLCWYQRIAMYPLVFIFLIGSLFYKRAVFAFAAPLVVAGWTVAIYHNLLHYEIIPESAAPCLQGVSCSTVYINWMGFITIPILSLTAFTILGFLLAVILKINKEISYEK